MARDEFDKLQEISRLLKEAYDHYFQYEQHCKSSEGHITVDYGNLWERGESENLKIKGVEIYSYVFCREGRSQYFDSVDKALEIVREWHEDELSYDYNSSEEVESRWVMDEAAEEFFEELMSSGRLKVINLPAPNSDEGDVHGFPV